MADKKKQLQTIENVNMSDKLVVASFLKKSLNQLASLPYPHEDDTKVSKERSEMKLKLIHLAKFGPHICHLRFALGGECFWH